MIFKKKVLGIITARGGSKGLPNKNILNLHGRPLIYWTIAAAKQSRYIDRLILSTDSEAIISLAQKYGCDVPFKRDSNLALDETASMTVVMDALERCSGYDCVVLLQPTSPLRTVEDIDGAIETMIEAKAPACVTLCEASESPSWMYKMNHQSQLKSISNAVPVSRRQELERLFVINGAVYVANIEWLRKSLSFIADETVGYVMSREKSIDIDCKLDFLLAEVLMGQE